MGSGVLGRLAVGDAGRLGWTYHGGIGEIRKNVDHWSIDRVLELRQALPWGSLPAQWGGGEAMSVSNALTLMVQFGLLIVSLLSLVVAVVILALKRK